MQNTMMNRASPVGQLGLGGESGPPEFDFQAAYKQYAMDEMQAGREPIPIEEFMRQIMSVLKQQMAQSGSQAGGGGLLRP